MSFQTMPTEAARKTLWVVMGSDLGSVVHSIFPLNGRVPNALG